MRLTDNKPFEEKQSTELAIGTFIISTALFILFIISNQNPNVLIIGWPFAISALILNAIMFFHLVENFIFLPQHRKDIAVKILIILSNIPISFFYYFLITRI